MILLQNKAIHKHYDIIDKYEAGIVLSGGEVKSLRNRAGSLTGAYVTIDKDEVLLMEMTIPKWRFESRSVDTKRPRKLLLKRSEIQRLTGKTKQKGFTLMPIAFYTKGRHIKLEIALVKGLKKVDVKAREKAIDREMEKESRLARYRKYGEQK